MEKEIFEQPETIAQTMQGRVKITPLSPMKYAVPGIDPYLMPRVRMGGLVDHVSVSLGCRTGAQAWRKACASAWHGSAPFACPYPVHSSTASRHDVVTGCRLRHPCLRRRPFAARGA